MTRLRIRTIIVWGATAWVLGTSSIAMALTPEPFIKDSFLNLPEDLAEANRQHKKLMVIYEQEGCPYCATMHRTAFSNPTIVETIKKNFDVVQLDIWGGREVVTPQGATMTEKEWSRRLGIQYSPMIVFFDASGKEIFRMGGFYKPPAFQSAIEYVASGTYTKRPFREYAVQNSRGASAPLHPSEFFVKTADLQALQVHHSRSNKGLAILFDQSGCDDCQDLRQRTLSRKDVLEKLASKYGGAEVDMSGMSAVKDIDGTQATGKKLAARHNVQSAPTIIFIGPDGKEQIRYYGYLEPEHFSTFLTYVTTDARTKYTSFQDWLRIKNAAKSNKAASK